MMQLSCSLASLLLSSFAYTPAKPSELPSPFVAIAHFEVFSSLQNHSPNYTSQTSPTTSPSLNNVLKTAGLEAVQDRGDTKGSREQVQQHFPTASTPLGLRASAGHAGGCAAPSSSRLRFSRQGGSHPILHRDEGRGEGSPMVLQFSARRLQGGLRTILPGGAQEAPSASRDKANTGFHGGGAAAVRHLPHAPPCAPRNRRGMQDPSRLRTPSHPRAHRLSQHVRVALACVSIIVNL